MNRGASLAYQQTVPTLAFVAGIAAAIAIVTFQGYGYVHRGFWTSLSVVDGLAWIGVGWSFMPDRWIGAYQLLRAFPLSLAVMLLGCGPYLITLLSTNRADRDGSI